MIAATSTPPTLSWRDAGLVALGGMLGTGLRHGLTLATPAPAEAALATLGINVVGAFALGLLVATLSRRGAASNARTRLVWGTGLLGGFTTYSALALDTVTLLEADRVASALAYGLGTVALGLAAAWAGLVLGHSRSPDVGEDAP